jgi:PEP-CTERM motif-containing protein
MKRYLLGVVMSVFMVGGAAALPCPSSGTLNQLIGTACTIDDKTFGDFQYIQTATSLTAADINFVTVGGPGATVDGFVFTFALTANSLQTADFSLIYDVLCTLGTNCIVSAELAFVGGADGGGSASVAETVCLGSLFGTGCTPSEHLFVSTAGSSSDSVTFAGQSVVGIGKDINASCAELSPCVATISILTNTVDQQAPEPATLLLFGSGLAGLAWFRRRKAS